MNRIDRSPRLARTLPVTRATSVLRALALGLTLVAGAIGAATPAATQAAKPAAAPAAAPADTTILIARAIHTMDPSAPEASALAFDASGAILALGTADALRARYPGAHSIDAGDATVVPGLIDAHGHLPNLGLALQRADLTGTRDKAEVIERLQAFAKSLPPGEWLLGGGWDQNDWPVKDFPTAADLDAAFPTRPVWIERIDGHADWANTAAMHRSSRPLDGTWQPDGGKIVRDAAGKATGILVDGATDLIASQLPAISDAATERMLAQAMHYAVARGLTGVDDPGVSLQQLRAYQRLADRGAMPLRVYAMADGDREALAWLCKTGPYAHPGGYLQMRALKLYADGALGSRGAALLEDYSDDPGNRGLLVTQPSELESAARKARDCGLQVATHAIGDRGNRIALDIYEKLLSENVGATPGSAGPDGASPHGASPRDAASTTGRRWRIEHAQVLSPSDIPRFAKLGVIASMQPTHATSDMPWAETRLGPTRIAGAYAWRQLLDSGARLAFGSDFPVESVDPRLGLHAAVTRTDIDGNPPGGWRPAEKLTRYEALRGFTVDAAYASFDEARLGSLSVGKRADFVVLGADPLDPASDLRTLPIRATYVNGRAVYTAP